MNDQPWHDSLSESATALALAVCDLRVAAQHAQVALRVLESPEFAPADVSVEEPSSLSFVKPHVQTVTVLGDLQRAHHEKLSSLFRETSLAYAHGVGEALHEVLRGRQPRKVNVRMDRGRYAAPSRPLPDLLGPLGTWGQADELDRLREDVTRREAAARTVADWDGDLRGLPRSYATELAAALDLDDGLAESAATYGDIARRGLDYAVEVLGSGTGK